MDIDQGLDAPSESDLCSLSANMHYTEETSHILSELPCLQVHSSNTPNLEVYESRKPKLRLVSKFIDQIEEPVNQSVEGESQEI